jgi:hypothetical protein
MNAKEGLKLVLGSVVVYVVMAACASVGTMSPSDTSAGAGSSGGAVSGSSSGGAVSGSSSGAASDGSGSSGASNGDDSGGMSLLDALTDPVPAAKADTTQSGSRLKAKYYVGSDGSKQFAGWHDSMLNVDCGFSLASDGTTRCIPTTATLVLAWFSDSGCSQPLAWVTSKGCAPATYAAQGIAPIAPACTTYSSRVFQVGAAYSGAIYTGTPANCSEQPDGGAALRATYDFYSVGSEVAPSTFVAATVQTDP